MIETEARWRSEKPVDDAEWMRVLGEFGIESGVARAIVVRDVYFDTADRVLMRGKRGVRKRVVERSAVMAVKIEVAADGPIAVHDEVELAADVDFIPEVAKDLPDALRHRVEPFTGIDPLMPLVTITNDRTQQDVVHVLSGARAVLSIDRYVGSRDQQTTDPVIEVELEWDPSGDEVFRDVAVVFGSRLGLVRAERSKLATVVGLLDPQAIDVEVNLKKLSEREWNRRVFELRFLRAADREAAFRLEPNAETTHDYRVAVRRLRAAVRAMNIAQSNVGRAADAYLTSILGILGTVRDDDVAIEGLRVVAATVDATRTKSRDALLAFLARRRARSAVRAHDFVLRSANVARWSKVRARLTAAAVAATDRSKDGSGQTIAVIAAGLLVEQFRKMRDAVEEAGSEKTPAAWHRARIRARTLRYLAEDFRPLYKKRLARFVEVLRERLDLAGRLQDAAATRDLLAAIASAERGAPARAKEAAAYFAVVLWNEIDGLEVEVSESWRAFSDTAGDLIARALFRY